MGNLAALLLGTAVVLCVVFTWVRRDTPIHWINNLAQRVWRRTGAHIPYEGRALGQTMVGIAGGGLFGWILGNSSLNVSIVSETTNVHVSTSSTASVFFLAAMLVLVLLGSILWVKGKPPLDEEGVRKVIREEFERATATISFGLTGPQGPVDPSRNVTFRTAADHLGISDATSRSNRAQRGGSDSLETRDNATGPTDVDQ